MKTSRSFLVAILLYIASTESIAQDWQWSQHFGGPGHDWGYIGAVDTAGNVYCYGNYAGPGPGTYSNMYIGGDTLVGVSGSFIAKFDPSGNMAWVKNCVSPNGGVGVSIAHASGSERFLVTGPERGNA
ncbi:MAG: hypothetical protein IPO87_09185 [Flavobacteriales bacterium]|nr:hypothetical protein [Flavobacteriales bacterium]